VVFDKTGTLTTGEFSIDNYTIHDPALSEEQFRLILFSLEKYSVHPIARCIVNAWKTKEEIRWASVEEVKGQGMKAADKEGNQYFAGSYAIAEGLTTESNHNIYLMINGRLAGWVDVKDEVRPEAAEVIAHLRDRGIRTLLLSGDRRQKANTLAHELGMDEAIAEKSPAEKLSVITALTAQTPTVMVGDGVNDAPALAKATIGISMSDASQVAMQTASVVLVGHGLKNLPMALGLGLHTYRTIRRNLFWAFSYNIIAIPVAAFGLLGTYGPTYGALLMGLSDVILAINSARLFVKKVA